MNVFASPPANGDTSPKSKKPPIAEPATSATSRLPGTTSLPGTSAAEITTALEPSKGKAAKRSPARPGKREIQQARSKIAVAYEIVTGELDKLPLAQQTMACVEGIRRLTRRLETIHEKLEEQNEPGWLER